MDGLIFALSLLVFVVGLAVFANKVRRTHLVNFDLKPNCLLTRWPVVFVTGPRSLFYFSRYWNLYPIFLAEHGYEVYTVHLPWHDRGHRRARFALFLEQQKNHGRNFHLILDPASKTEFQDLLQNAFGLKSLTEISDKITSSSEASANLLRPAFSAPYSILEFSPSPKAGFFLELSYRLHRLFLKNRPLPSLNTLAAVSQTAIENSLQLLERAQTLAEMDLRDE